MLVLLEGFDHYEDNIGGLPQQKSMKGWNGNTVGTAPGRLPYGAQSHSLQVIINNGASKPLPSTYGEVYFGFAFLVTIMFDGSIAYLNGSGGPAIGLSGGKLALYDNTNAVVAVGTNTLTSNTWYYAEGHFTSTHGEAQLNGLTEIGSTAGSFGGSFHEIGFQYQVLGAQMNVDDVYVCDTTGGINDHFLGDLVVETLYPISDGTYTQWTPDIGGAHWPRVSEFLIDEDASYVHTTTAGAKDTYGIGNPVLANTPVYGVQLNLGVRKNDAGTRTVEPVIRQSGVDHTGPLSALTIGYTFHSWLRDTDPTGNPWTYSTVNNDEYGIELVS